MRETGQGPLEAVKDPLYRLTRTDRTNPGATPPNQWTWNYDAVGNRTSAQKDSEATTSSYNEKNQLTGATGGGKMLWRGTLDEPGIATFSAPTINGQPARMLAGNVFEATLDLPVGANNVTIQAQDGSGNVATKVYSVNVIGVPSSYTYDANGNLSAKTDDADSWTYTWNAENRLISVSKNGAIQGAYSYDPFGRRVEKAVAGVVTRFVYAKEAILRQEQGAVTTLFIHGPAMDEPLVSETAGTRSFFHPDTLGSIVVRSNDAGVASINSSYSPWGEVAVVDGGYSFTGREWDPETRLHFYRARYYDPAIGRFVSEDPSGFADGPNRYSYVRNRPADRIDPSGRITEAESRYCQDPRNWGRCKSALLCAGFASLAMAGFDDDSPGNAVKHCSWACCLARAEGAQAAYDITTAHEFGEPNLCQVDMDMTNNATGIALGLANSGSCFDLCNPSNLRCQPRRPPCRRWPR